MPPWLDVDVFAPPGGATSGASLLMIPFEAVPFIFIGHLFVENTTYTLESWRIQEYILARPCGQTPAWGAAGTEVERETLHQGRGRLYTVKFTASEWWYWEETTYFVLWQMIKSLQFRQIQVVVSGMSCKQRCVENFRPCKCLEKLNCAISGNAVIIDFGGSQYRWAGQRE